MLGLIGKKVGMTQVFTKEGELVPVTVLEVGPCHVVQRKLPETDGYASLQIGFGTRRARLVSKAYKGHFEKRSLPIARCLMEFRTDAAGNFEVGQELSVEAFQVGERVNVMGRSKGRGFQGVMKRHGKHGGPASHGSDFHRRPGSIGMRTWPARVPKNTRLPGHMGDERVTIKGLEVIEVRGEENVLLLRGAVPGAIGSVVTVTTIETGFETRPELVKRSTSNDAVEQQPTPEVAEKVAGEEAQPEADTAKE